MTKKGKHGSDGHQGPLGPCLMERINEAVFEVKSIIEKKSLSPEKASH